MKIHVVLKDRIEIEGTLVSHKENEMVIESDNGITTVIPSVSDSVIFYQVRKQTKNYESTKKPRVTQYPVQEGKRIHPDFAARLRAVQT